MSPSFTIGRIGGITIGIHYTWLIAFALITWTLAAGFFPESFPGWDTLSYWTTGAVAALGLFVSVLVHELAHSFVAKAKGIPVHSITLFIFGGVSNLKTDAARAGDEFLIAVVGPVTSIVIGILAGLLFSVLSGVNLVSDQRMPADTPPIVAIVFYLAFINLILGVFNLLPGFPLDGGRVLRSIIWAATRSLPRATQIAGTIGQIVAFAFIGLGVLQILNGEFFSGLWIAFIGWFLNSAADASKRDVAVQEQLRGVPVSLVMDRSPVTVGPDVLVSDLVMDIFLRRGVRAVPVYNDGFLRGIASITDAKDLPSDRWPSTRVEQIMTRQPLHAVSPDDGLATALRILAEKNVNQLLVLQHGRLVGLLSRADVIRYLQFREELGIGAPPGR
jgi:Zn-dependent protease/CBS domain-containing protein